MKRELTDKEIRRIKEIIKNRSNIMKYEKVVRVVLPIFIIAICIFLYTQIKFGNIYIYFIIGVLLSTIAIFEMNRTVTPYALIDKNKYICIEAQLIGSRIVKTQTSNDHIVEINYLLLNIDEKNKEVEYIGENFDSLKIGDKIIVIHTKINNINDYICFSYEELNR